MALTSVEAKRPSMLQYIWGGVGLCLKQRRVCQCRSLRWKPSGLKWRSEESDKQMAGYVVSSKCVRCTRFEDSFLCALSHRKRNKKLNWDATRSIPTGFFPGRFFCWDCRPGNCRRIWAFTRKCFVKDDRTTFSLENNRISQQKQSDKNQPTDVSPKQKHFTRSEKCGQKFNRQTSDWTAPFLTPTFVYPFWSEFEWILISTSSTFKTLQTSKVSCRVCSRSISEVILCFHVASSFYLFHFTSLPLRKARSSVWADGVSVATRPLVVLSYMNVVHPYFWSKCYLFPSGMLLTPHLSLQNHPPVVDGDGDFSVTVSRRIQISFFFWNHFLKPHFSVATAHDAKLCMTQRQREQFKAFSDHHTRVLTSKKWFSAFWHARCGVYTCMWKWKHVCQGGGASSC